MACSVSYCQNLSVFSSTSVICCKRVYWGSTLISIWVCLIFRMVLSFNVCWLMFSRKTKKTNRNHLRKMRMNSWKSKCYLHISFHLLENLFSYQEYNKHIYFCVIRKERRAMKERHTEPVFQSHSNQSIFGVNKQPELNWSLLLSYSLFRLWLWNGKNKSKCCIVYFSFHLLAIIIRLQSEKPNWIENLIWLAWVSMRIILFHTKFHR